MEICPHQIMTMMEKTPLSEAFFIDFQKEK